ncbi:phage tail protein [Novosphingobium guangzhouense]|uniref:Phage tail protein n=1 Tax=Novosphingobium guangzhouense TaxID=1850347 RepID=A0A2K2G614_9SPHN|nr:phage tail protein [Novosphingobium guangzhouense]PNU06477.1 hypothetical protein A8V01_02735 [Novosphingobium guangzhouense]
MRKIDTLKAAIFAALPELGTDPDRIRIWIERGTAKSTQTGTRGLAYAFQLNVLVVEMASDISILFLAVFQWMRVNQPDLMMPNADAIGFDAEILDNGTADVLLQLQLDQAVSAAPRADGGFDLQYQGEPDPFDTSIMSILEPEPAPVLTGFEVDEDTPPWEP